jgi:hypothetical protein
MNTQLNAMKQALTALEQGLGHLAQDILRTAEREAAQTAPVPVRPAAQRQFVGLSEEELAEIAMQSGAYDEQLLAFARAIETKLKEKNGSAT